MAIPKGHVSLKEWKKADRYYEQGNFVLLSTQMITGVILESTELISTTTNCDAMTAQIEKFFNERYEQIAEESSQGQGPHLEALAFQVDCNAQQTVILEKAMKRNYHREFAKEDINHSINEFYTLVNSDDQLAA